jgi:hypothetical protein
LLGVSTGLVVTSAVVIPTSILLIKKPGFSKLLKRQAKQADIPMIKGELTNAYDYKINNSYAFQSLSSEDRTTYIHRFETYIDHIISAAKDVGLSYNDLADRLGEEALDDSIKVLDYMAIDQFVERIKDSILGKDNLGNAEL